MNIATSKNKEVKKLYKDYNKNGYFRKRIKQKSEDMYRKIISHKHVYHEHLTAEENAELIENFNQTRKTFSRFLWGLMLRKVIPYSILRYALNECIIKDDDNIERPNLNATCFIASGILQSSLIYVVEEVSHKGVNKRIDEVEW